MATLESDSVLLQDLAAVRSFWIQPDQLQPWVSLGTTTNRAEWDIPWITLCGTHRLQEELRVNVRRQLSGLVLAETAYLYIALWLGRLHFVPMKVFGKAGWGWQRVCQDDSHVTLAYLPPCQAISIATLRGRLQEAIDDWLRLRSRPYERPSTMTLNWSRSLYLDCKGGELDSEGWFWDRAHIRDFSPEQLVGLARDGRIHIANSTEDEIEGPLEDVLLDLQEKDHRRVCGFSRFEDECASWFVGTDMSQTFVEASFLAGPFGHMRPHCELLNLCRYLRRVVESSCSLPPLRNRGPRCKLATDTEMHAAFTTEVTPRGPIVRTWDANWGCAQRVSYSEARLAPPVKQWQPCPDTAPRTMHSFASQAVSRSSTSSLE